MQLDLFAPRHADPASLFTPPKPHKQGDVARLWHGLHPHRTAWFFYDEANRIWTCIDPFDTHGINYRNEVPVVNQCGRLVA